MSSCTQCFEISLGLVDPRRAQGHTFCSPPSEGQKAAYVHGIRPNFQNNRWAMREAARSHNDDNDGQIWMIDNEYFTVNWEKAESKPAEPIS